MKLAVHNERPASSANGDRKKEWRVLRIGLMGLDCLALSAAVAAAALVRFWLEDLSLVSELATDRHLIASLLVVPVLLALFKLQGLYSFEHILAGTREYVSVAHAATYGLLIALAASYFAGGGPLVSRTWMLLIWVMTVAFVGGSRFALRRFVRHLKQRGRLRTRVAIVGASSLGVDIAQQLLSSREEGIDIVGFFDEYLPIGEMLVAGIRVIGRPELLAQGEGALLADEYILVPAALPHERLEEIMRVAGSTAGPVLRLAVSSSELLTHGVEVVQRGGVPLLTAHRASITGADAILKRSLDIVFASIALLILAPLAAIFVTRGMAARRGVVFRRRDVYGVGGAPVALWLFEPSITSWLPVRGLPALISVVQGKLSLVGPRPLEYRAGGAVRSLLGLTAAKPGLTGPWRLSGGETSLARQAILDLAYVRNYSIWEDLRILQASVTRLRNRRSMSLTRWHERSTLEDEYDVRPVDGLLPSYRLN
jgi:lipopolysaccharide/colanic/teichoic acid biosynthesis glycosyltransferase